MLLGTRLHLLQLLRIDRICPMVIRLYIPFKRIALQIRVEVFCPHLQQSFHFLRMTTRVGAIGHSLAIERNRDVERIARTKIERHFLLCQILRRGEEPVEDGVMQQQTLLKCAVLTNLSRHILVLTHQQITNLGSQGMESHRT